eukprot:4287508-Alexandrium_andersonii.AAC.1
MSELRTLPSVVLLNQTCLDTASPPRLTGNTCVARRDRQSGWGGVAVFARDGIAELFAHLGTSTTAER